MGIPAYFSHIVKNHSSIIRKITNNPIKVEHLYLDCNSIIYDAFYKLSASATSSSSMSQLIISKVILTIKEYIHILKPSCTVFIAFDGVAPVAKLEQQRCRRFKSLYQNALTRSILKSTEPEPWNSTVITPGTVFMQQLDEQVTVAFKDASLFNVNTIIVSGSDQHGEGEHKLFKHIRDNRDSKNTIIYGLDADLIMLSINHLPINPNIYLFRETPEFIKSLNSELDPNELYALDIPEFANAIISTMTTSDTMTINTYNINLIYDYVLLCFFLGNDFMPHFPAINIRTGGIEKMIQAYKQTVVGEYLTNGNTINWNVLRKLVGYLASQETDYFKQEHKLRDRKEKIKMPNITPEDKVANFIHIPTYERDTEKYINPYKLDWQSRYYHALLINDSVEIKKMCIQYLQGLEWTMKYYTSGCPDWKWCYSYNYPPLLQDLIQYIPCSTIELVTVKPEQPVTNLVQLCYVLPRQSLQFLPEPLYKAIIETKLDQYKTECDFSWAYCKYFWECHPNLPTIDIDELEAFVINNNV